MGEPEDIQGTSIDRPLPVRVLPAKQEHASQRHVRIEMVETSSGRWKAFSDLNSNAADETPTSTCGPPKPHKNSGGEAPLRQQPADNSVIDISDDDSGVDPELQAQQVRARVRLTKLRQRVFRTRSYLRELRDRLRVLRQDVREAADNLTRKVSECIALRDTGALQKVVPLYEILRSAQDAIGPVEEEYDRLETSLDGLEFDLEQEEDHFDRRVDLSTLGSIDPTNIPAFNLNKELSPLIKPYQPSECELSQLSITNERLAGYLEKTAEANDLKQELNSLEDDYERLIKDIAFRKRYRVPASKEAIQFIDMYPPAHEETLRKLYDIEDDIENLRQLCIREEVFKPSEYVYTPRSALYVYIMDVVDEHSARSPFRTAANDLEYPETVIDFSDKRDYINKWLLKRVQESALETMLLRTHVIHEFAPHSAVLMDDKWSRVALENWGEDKAGERANQACEESRMDMILGDPRNVDTLSTAQITGFPDVLTDIGSLQIDASGSDYSSLSTSSPVFKVSTAKHRSRSAPATIWRTRLSFS